MLVNTLSFMCSDPTAVMTVRLLTDTTNAVPSTRTRESREPLLAARSTPCESLPERALIELDASALDACERVLGELQVAGLARLLERVGERRARLDAARAARGLARGAIGGFARTWSTSGGERPAEATGGTPRGGTRAGLVMGVIRLG